jgi:hypothetical protein
MSTGKTIQIFLSDSNPLGMRIAEIISRTVMVLPTQTIAIYEAFRTLYEQAIKGKHTQNIEMDNESFDWLYGQISHPIAVKKGQKFAVRVVSWYGEESATVVEL